MGRGRCGHWPGSQLVSCWQSPSPNSITRPLNVFEASSPWKLTGLGSGDRRSLLSVGITRHSTSPWKAAKWVSPGTSQPEPPAFWKHTPALPSALRLSVPTCRGEVGSWPACCSCTGRDRGAGGFSVPGRALALEWASQFKPWHMVWNHAAPSYFPLFLLLL